MGACRPVRSARKERPLESMPAPTALVTVGVDTHLQVHVAAVVDQTGRLLDARGFPASTRGYVAWSPGPRALARWSDRGGRHRHLRRRAGPLRPRLRPPGGRGRPARPQHPTAPGKSDPVDAQAAARATLAGVAATTPKTREGQVETIRVLRVARRGALKARVAAAEQPHGVPYSAPKGSASRCWASRPAPWSVPARPCGPGYSPAPAPPPRPPCGPWPAAGSSPRHPAASAGRLGRPYPGRPARARC